MKMALLFYGNFLSMNENDPKIMAVLQAARQLVDCKGRYHTELNFKTLVAAVKRLDEGIGGA